MDLHAGGVQVVLQDVGAGERRHTGRALTDEEDALDGAVGDGPVDRRRHRLFIEGRHKALLPVVLDLPAVLEGLLHRGGGLGDLLQEIVRKMLAIDIARGERRGLDVLIRQRHGGPVVAHGGDPLQAARCLLVQDEELALGLAGFAVHNGFAVEPDVGGRLLDEPVDLRGGHVVVRGDADEDGLSAAALGEKELARREARVHGDGVGALEVADRAPEGFGDTEPLPQVVLDLQRNDLGVGGDIGVDAARRCVRRLL